MLKKRLNSFRYAFSGIATLFRSEPNAKIHLALTMLVVAGGFFFRLDTKEWSIIVLAIVAVLSAEAFNTAIEQLTDLVSPDYHPLAGKAKDLSAGAVLLVAIGAALVGVIIFLPKIVEKLGVNS
jgi:diacylglycerol kinase